MGKSRADGSRPDEAPRFFQGENARRCLTTARRRLPSVRKVPVNPLRNEGGSVGTSLAQTVQERRDQFHTLRLGEYLDPFNAAVASFLEQARGVFLQQTGDPVAAQQLNLHKRCRGRQAKRPARPNLFIKIPGTKEVARAIGGSRLQRRADQRHAALLARALSGRGRGVHAWPGAPDYLGLEPGRSLGCVAVRQPLGQGDDGQLPENLRDRLGIAVAESTYAAYRDLLELGTLAAP